MRRALVYTISTLFLLLSSTIWMSIETTANVEATGVVGGPLVHFNPFRADISAYAPGTMFTVYIRIENVSSLVAFQAGFYFDPMVLICVSVLEGGFLSDNGNDPIRSFPGVIDNVNGIVAPYGWILENEADAKEGCGDLVRITFEVNLGLWPVPDYADYHLLGFLAMQNSVDQIPCEIWDHFTIAAGFRRPFFKIVGNAQGAAKLGCYSHHELSTISESIGGIMYYGQFSFNATGNPINGSPFAYFNVTIPKCVMWCNSKSDWVVLLDDVLQPSRTVSENTTHTTISLEFDYNAAEHNVKIRSTHIGLWPVYFGDLICHPKPHPPFVPSTVPRQGEPIIIQVNVTSLIGGSTINSVQLHYRASEGEWWNSVMAPSNATANVWETVMPGQEGGVAVELYFEAHDISENTATSDMYTFNVKALSVADINGDGIVNIKDAALLGLNWLKMMP